MKRAYLIGVVVLASCGGDSSERTPAVSKADVALCRAMDSVLTIATASTADGRTEAGERDAILQSLDRLRDRADAADDRELNEYGVAAADGLRVVFMNGTSDGFESGSLDGFSEKCEAIGAPSESRDASGVGAQRHSVPRRLSPAHTAS